MSKLFVTPMYPDAYSIAYGTFVRAHFESIKDFKLIYPGNKLRLKSKILFYFNIHLLFILNIRWRSQVIIHYPLYFPLLYLACLITQSNVHTIIHGGEVMHRPHEKKIILFIKYVSKIIHFRCSKYIFVPTNYVKIRYYAASDKILVWYSGGVESDRNFSQNFNGKREIDILFVGRIDPVKGIDQVLDLLNENRVKNNKKKICIVGPQCIDYFASYEGGGVELHDSVPPNVVRRLMSQAKLVVIPSLNESFCLVAAESYLSGCNLLLNKLPALREIFLERQGVIFEERGAEFTRKALNHEYEPISTVERINLHKKINRSAMMERFKKCLY